MFALVVPVRFVVVRRRLGEHGRELGEESARPRQNLAGDDQRAGDGAPANGGAEHAERGNHRSRVDEGHHQAGLGADDRGTAGGDRGGPLAEELRERKDVVLCRRRLAVVGGVAEDGDALGREAQAGGEPLAPGPAAEGPVAAVRAVRDGDLRDVERERARRVFVFVCVGGGGAIGRRDEIMHLGEDRVRGLGRVERDEAHLRGDVRAEVAQEPLRRPHRADVARVRAPRAERERRRAVQPAPRPGPERRRVSAGERREEGDDRERARDAPEQSPGARRVRLRANATGEARLAVERRVQGGVNGRARGGRRRAHRGETPEGGDARADLEAPPRSASKCEDRGAIRSRARVRTTGRSEAGIRLLTLGPDPSFLSHS